MIACPYKSSGCNYEAPNHYDMEEHLIAMSHTDDKTHNPESQPIKSFRDVIACTGDPAEEEQS